MALVHRLGQLEVGEVSVAVAVSCPHRGRGVRGLPLRHRPAQGTGADLEERKLGRRQDGMGPSRSSEAAVMNLLQPRPLPTDAPSHDPLIDTFGRVHNNLRISVTDRCNLRCTYCMPEEVVFLDRAELLTFEEIAHFVRVAAPLGIDKVRLTGGEPLMRRDLPRLVRMLVAIPGIRDVGLTTNGLLLADQAQALYDAGLRRINISLDTLDPERFRQLTRRDGLDQVLAGIDAAKQAGFEPIKVNAVSIRGVTEHGRGAAGPLRPRARPGDALHRVHADRRRGLGARARSTSPTRSWSSSSASVAPLVPAEDYDPRAPAMDFDYTDGGGRVGIIASVSRPFCLSCNRLRLTADGKLRNCLFALDEVDVKPLLRGQRDDAATGGGDPPERARRSGKGTRSTRPASSSRCGPCTPSAGEFSGGSQSRAALRAAAKRSDGDLRAEVLLREDAAQLGRTPEAVASPALAAMSNHCSSPSRAPDEADPAQHAGLVSIYLKHDVRRCAVEEVNATERALASQKETTNAVAGDARQLILEPAQRETNQFHQALLVPVQMTAQAQQALAVVAKGIQTRRHRPAVGPEDLVALVADRACCRSFLGLCGKEPLKSVPSGSSQCGEPSCVFRMSFGVAACRQDPRTIRTDTAEVGPSRRGGGWRATKVL